MMTSSNGNIFRVTGHLCGAFTGPGCFPAQRQVTRNFDVFFDLRPNKRLSKQSWGWWVETLSRSLWRHCNEISVKCQIMVQFHNVRFVNSPKCISHYIYNKLNRNACLPTDCYHCIIDIIYQNSILSLPLLLYGIFLHTGSTSWLLLARLFGPPGHHVADCVRCGSSYFPSMCILLVCVQEWCESQLCCLEGVGWGMGVAAN